MGVVSEVISGLTGPVATYFQRRSELKAAAHQQELALQDARSQRQIDLIKTGLAADASWENIFAQQAASSWKDEYTLIVVSVPLVMAFIPGLAPFVTAGFAAFASTPLWYQAMVQVIFYATYGIRFWRRNQSDT